MGLKIILKGSVANPDPGGKKPRKCTSSFGNWKIKSEDPFEILKIIPILFIIIIFNDLVDNFLA